MAREFDPRFDPGEVLYRRVSVRALDKDGRVRSGHMRPQLSVNRHRFDGIKTLLAEGARPEDNGHAQTTVSAVRPIAEGAVSTIVAHEPTAENNAHSLIVLTTAAGLEVDVAHDVEAWKQAVALAFVVANPPTKP